ncbi:MAG: sister chromatid cohesion protein PDS5 [Candidatus Hydrothermarchaeales archaeon]
MNTKHSDEYYRLIHSSENYHQATLKEIQRIERWLEEFRKKIWKEIEHDPEKLRRLLVSAKDPQQVQLFSSLVLRGNEQVLQGLIQLLHDNDAKVRAFAITALDELTTDAELLKSVIPKIKNLLKDKNAKVRVCAADVLRKTREDKAESKGKSLSEVQKLKKEQIAPTIPEKDMILESLTKGRYKYEDLEDIIKTLAEYLKAEYTTELRKSRDDMKRSTYYCAELFLLNVKLGEASESMKYCHDLKRYSGERVKKEVDKLSEELEHRLKEGLGISNEFAEKAEVIVHQIKMS